MFISKKNGYIIAIKEQKMFAVPLKISHELLGIRAPQVGNRWTRSLMIARLWIVMQCKICMQIFTKNCQNMH